MEEIVVQDDGNEVKGEIVFPQLKLLEFQRIPNLRIFFSGIYEIELPLLESLKLNECNKMKSFSYGSLRTPMLQRIEINGSSYPCRGDLNTTIMGCEANLHCQSFSFADLKIATRNFGRYDRSSGIDLSTDCTVYKRRIDEETFAPSKTGTGMLVSIKRLTLNSWQEFMEGKLELNILDRLSHPNLVKCIGYCWEDRCLFLVYEFMERGNLDNHLFTRNSVIEPLSWNLRIKIAIGAARGLDFLHTEKKVIHRDIKPSVIMLDGNYNAKISGFGLAISWPSDGDSHVTTTVIGNSSHTDPEYIATGHCYVKSDVYSFGVVLLELMTGLRAIDTNRPKEQQNLLDWSKPNLSRKRKLINIIDPKIEGQYSLEAMSLAAQLSLKCLESKAKSRPSMKEVVDALEQILVTEKKQARR